MTTNNDFYRLSIKPTTMKTLIPIFLFSLLSVQLFGQGMITGMTVVPANPTEGDDIEIHVDLQFSSGDCQVDDQGLGTNGNSITAYAHHCVGMLTVICETTDTFELGQLGAGGYTFNMSLSSGFGGAGCSPGIVIDDSDQLQFIVSQSVGIDESDRNDFLVFPNPAEDVLNFTNSLTENATITNVSGQIVKHIPAGARNVDVHELEPGIYFLNLGTRKVRVLKN